MQTLTMPAGEFHQRYPNKTALGYSARTHSGEFQQSYELPDGRIVEHWCSFGWFDRFFIYDAGEWQAPYAPDCPALRRAYL